MAADTLELPDESVLEGAADLDERARRFAREMLLFNGRTERWWQMFAGERNELPQLAPLQAAEQRYWESVARLQKAALGDLATDPNVVAAMAMLISWTTLSAISSAGLGVAEGIELAADLFAYAVRHAAQLSVGG
jgi:hypothetical protein